MQEYCKDCLSREVCEISGGACQKMGALFIQRKSIANGRTTMSNTPKATSKTVTDASETKVEEKTIPAQAKAEKNDEHDTVLDNAGKILFSGAPDEVKAWLNKQPTMIYVVRQTKSNGLIVSTEYVEEGPLKLTLMQRAKAAAEKLKQNKKAVLILTGAAVVVGLTVKNNRKAVAVEPLGEAEGPINGVDEITGPDDSTDSL